MFRFAIAALVLTSAAVSAAPTLKFTVPNTPNQAQQSFESLNSSGALSSVATTVLSDLGQIDNLVENEIINAILAQEDEIESIDNIILDFDNISASFKHNGSTIGFEINDIGFIFDDIRADVDGIGSIFCPSVKFDAEFEDFKISANYNRSSGTISNITTDYDIDVFNSSCSGIFGFVVGIFGIDSLVVNPIIEGRIEAAIDVLKPNLSDSVFSLKSFYQNLLGKLSGVLGKTNLEMLKTFTVNTANRVGLQLDMEIDRAHNIISFVSRQFTPSLITERLGANIYVENKYSANGASALDVYIRYSGSNQVSLLRTLGGNGGTIPCYTNAAAYYFVARQPIANGYEARSFPAMRGNISCTRPNF